MVILYGLSDPICRKDFRFDDSVFYPPGSVEPGFFHG